jgi:hypothetical protein
VTDMSSLFGYSLFDHSIGNWDVSNVISMYNMFNNCPFDQNIGNWDVGNVTYMNGIFQYSGLSTENYDSLLIGWASLPILQANVDFHGGSSQYCDGANAKQTLIDTYGWIITDGGAASSVNTWIGPSSGEWNDPVNWSSGFVPKFCDDVTVPPNINIIVPAGEDAYCNSLIIGSGVTVDVEPGATLYVINP